MPELRDLHLLRATGAPRVEKYDGKDHIVVPCVALMETVIHAVNSDDPELVPLDTLKTAANSWDGKPVVLGHPVKDGQQIPAATPGVYEERGLGTIKHPRVQGTKLLMDMYLDPERVKRICGSKFLEEMQAGKNHTEVSVGAYVSTERKESIFNGKAYKAIWRVATGDHLAILPNGRGACSVAAGCGTHRAASVYVAAEEFRAASEKEIKALAKMVDCPTCDGDGTFNGNECPTCGGNGEVPASAKQLLGKRHSQKDTEIIQGVHDHAVALGASCSDDKPMKGAEARYLGDSLVENSLNERMQDVQEAVDAQYNQPYPQTNSVYTYPVAVYDDHVIIRQGDQLYSCDYTLDNDGEVVLSDKMTEVKQAYVTAAAKEPDTIRVEGGRYVVYSKNGARRLGSHATREDAEAQEQAIARSLARQQAECGCGQH